MCKAQRQKGTATVVFTEVFLFGIASVEDVERAQVARLGPEKLH